MATLFFERPILNSPYEVPTQHHALDGEGQPLDQEPAQSRRRSSLITPVPKSKKQRGKGKQTALGLGDGSGLSSREQAYDLPSIINEIRGHVASWRALPNPADCGVTPTTQRLLQHRRHDKQPLALGSSLEAPGERPDGTLQVGTPLERVVNWRVSLGAGFVDRKPD